MDNFHNNTNVSTNISSYENNEDNEDNEDNDHDTNDNASITNTNGSFSNIIKKMNTDENDFPDNISKSPYSDINIKTQSPYEIDNTINTNANVNENIKFKSKLVLSGGGIKGIAHIGALYALEQINCLSSITEFSGTSVGSLIIALHVIGYTASELYDFIKLFNLGKLKDISIVNIQLFGLDTGSRVEYVIKRLINGKNLNENITLKELYEKTSKKIIFVTVCLNNMEVCYVSHETFPELPLYLAIRMSISIPLIYCPVIYQDKMYIDGGCLDNYPISIFKDNITETIGIILFDAKDNVEKIDNFETYIFRVLDCMIRGMMLNLKNGYDQHTIEIHVESINIANYEIDNIKKDELFIKGYKAVMNNIEKLKIN